MYRKLTSKKFLLGPIIFSFVLATMSGALFHVWAQEIGDPNVLGAPPIWCPPAEHEGLATVCGTVYNSQLEVDENGNWMPNLPLNGITVAAFEENPISPTGKIDGMLSNIFSSTSTNVLGRYQISVRKVKPPMVRIHLVFMCGTKVAAHKQIDSWHDSWDLNVQLNCQGAANSVTSGYIRPNVPLEYLDRSSMLSCYNDVQKDTPVGMSKNETPTINNIIEEQNYDHRHTKQMVNIDLPLTGIAAGINFSFESPGGLWEPDCLLRYDKFMCNAPAGCTWDNASTQLTFNENESPVHYGAPIGGTLCTGDATNPMSVINRPDYLTRPFFVFLPKTGSDLPFRRLDLRSNLENFIMDPLTPMQWYCKMWGCASGNPYGKPLVYMREYAEADDPLLDPLPSCEDLKLRNNVAQISRGPYANKQLNSGPYGGMASPDDTLQKIYYSVVRDLSEPVCVTPDRDQSNPVRFCEIQPPWSPAGLCSVGDPDCHDPDFATNVQATLNWAVDPYHITAINNSLVYCGGTFLLGSDYFNTDKIFPNGTAYYGFNEYSPNDSMGANGIRPLTFEGFDTESEAPHQTGSRGNLIDGGRNKSNSTRTMSAMATIQEYVPNTETLSDTFTIPFADEQEDYVDHATWNIGDIGSGEQMPLCTLGNPYVTPVSTVAQEIDPDFHPDNLFAGNTDQIRHKAVGTSTFYFSPDAIERDDIMQVKPSLGAILDPDWNFRPLIGMRRNGGDHAVDIVLSNIVGRDIWDSILSLSGGDTKIHEFNIDLATIIGAITAANAITDESAAKTFGDRDTSLASPMQKPYYNVEYTLNEENFATEYYMLPDPNAGDQVLAEEWGMPGASPEGHGCYPFVRVPENQYCGTYREGDFGISRTCRLDECHAFWQVESRTCRCSTDDGNNFNCDWSGDPTWDIEHGDCSIQDRIICAREQLTTEVDIDERIDQLDVEHDQVPTRIIHDEDPDFGPGTGTTHDHYEGCYNSNGTRCDSDPPDVTAVANCDLRPNQFNNCRDASGNWICVGTQTRSHEVSRDGDVRPRCEMAVAGPMNGGLGCNGTVEVGDFAMRASQKEPFAEGDPAYKPQVDLDQTFLAPLKFWLSFRSPGSPAYKGIKIGTLDALSTNKPEGIPEGRYTYGAQVGLGSGEVANMSLLVTPPTFPGDRDTPLNQLFYHCDLVNTYVPGTRGALDFVDYDPELGLLTLDTDNDGVMDAAEPGWRCPIVNVPEPEIAEIPDVGGSCAISAAQLANCGAAFNSVPDSLSESFRRIINYAADRAQVPAAGLIAVLSTEGGFLPQYDQFWAQDATVDRWGLPWYARIDAGGPITCIDMVWSAQGPYSFLQSSFNSFAQGELCDELNEISPGRCESASRCNFVDVTLAAALHLSRRNSGENCSNINMQEALNSYSGGSYTNEGGLAGVMAVYNACRQ